MVPSVRLMQLYSLRAQVDALIAADEAEFQVIQVQAGCPHPEDQRVNASNFGEEPRFYCRVCKEMVIDAMRPIVERDDVS